MFSKQEATLLRQQFWTNLGKYLSPVNSANGEKINWINYKTGVRYIRFIMEAGDNSARVSIEISHPDPVLRNLFYQQFNILKTRLEESIGCILSWENEVLTEHGKQVSFIQDEITGVCIYKKEDWPRIIPFFKSRMVGMDLFWTDYKEVFEMTG
ncbi:MAG: DUF4268 domain-containing protein [Ferruginibacter sp.]